MGPFYCCNAGHGELTSIDGFNPAWIRANLSQLGQTAARFSADRGAPIGVSVAAYAENERHRMFTNRTGLVRTHMPWVILNCVSWMEDFPCTNNNIYLVDQAMVDAYGRYHETKSMDLHFIYAAEGNS
eukprot:63073-Amphidinium_carterae.1